MKKSWYKNGVGSKSFRDDSSINSDINSNRALSRRTSSVLSTTKLKFGKKKVNQYEIEKTLGKGSFAKVYLCIDKNTKTKYALKEMDKALLKKQKAGRNKFAIDCVIDELKVL